MNSIDYQRYNMSNTIFAVVFFKNPMWGLRHARNHFEYENVKMFTSESAMRKAVSMFLKMDELPKSKSFGVTDREGVRAVEVRCRSLKKSNK